MQGTPERLLVASSERHSSEVVSPLGSRLQPQVLAFEIRAAKCKCHAEKRSRSQHALSLIDVLDGGSGSYKEGLYKLRLL